MVALRALMEAHLAGWRDNLPNDRIGPDGVVAQGWQEFFAACPDPDFDAIPAQLDLDAAHRVFPGRQGHPIPNAPEGAHLCRAFNDIQPAGVRVVVLGQDPYASIAKATGRAFEDGCWEGGRPQNIASSLKLLILAAWATQRGQERLFRTGGWPDLIENPAFAIPQPSAYFDSLAQQGVLFINAAWTRTREQDLDAHLNLWKPVMNHLLQKLARDDQTVVFLLLGENARKWFCAADPVCNRSAIVTNAHPRSHRFFERNNPLIRVNLALDVLEAQEQIAWWPPQEPEGGNPE